MPKIKRTPITATALLQALVLWSQKYSPTYEQGCSHPYWIDMLRELASGKDHLFHYYINLNMRDMEDLIKERFYTKHEVSVNWCDTIHDLFLAHVKCKPDYVRELASLMLKKSAEDLEILLSTAAFGSVSR